MIASLGNLDVGKVAGSKPESSRVEVRHVARPLRNDDERLLRLISGQNSAKNLSGRGDFVQPDESVNFGKFAREFALIALR
jgi:hypothetical protein